MLNKLCMGLILWDERPLNKIKKMKKKNPNDYPFLLVQETYPFLVQQRNLWVANCPAAPYNEFDQSNKVLMSKLNQILSQSRFGRMYQWMIKGSIYKWAKRFRCCLPKLRGYSNNNAHFNSQEKVDIRKIIPKPNVPALCTCCWFLTRQMFD